MYGLQVCVGSVPWLGLIFGLGGFLGFALGRFRVGLGLASGEPWVSLGFSLGRFGFAPGGFLTLLF